jgi:putative ABC transport system ATP-binding protein
MNNEYVCKLENVSKLYHRGTETVYAVDSLSLTIKTGEYCSIVGPSGSGKTTLMNLMGCLDRPTTGKIIINNKEIQNESEKNLTKLRQTTIGFVFQQFFLIPTLSVFENVQLPGLFARNINAEKARQLLSLVGLEKRLDHLPGQLSGGEMQRVAIARSLINDPKLLLADEPTGNLDSKNAETIMSLFDQLHKSGITIVVITHNQSLAHRCNRIVSIEDGKISS